MKLLLKIKGTNQKGADQMFDTRRKELAEEFYTLLKKFAMFKDSDCRIGSTKPITAV